MSGCGFYVSDISGTSVVTEERRIVGGQVEPATPFLALCEVAGDGGAAAAQEFWTAWARRLAGEVTVDHYRLLYGLGWI